MGLLIRRPCRKCRRQAPHDIDADLCIADLCRRCTDRKADLDSPASLLHNQKHVRERNNLSAYLPRPSRSGGNGCA